MAKEAILHRLRQFLEARTEVSFAYLHGSVLDEGVYHDGDAGRLE